MPSSELKVPSQGVSLHPRTADLTNMRFGKLAVISFYSYNHHGGKQRAQWLCKCDCGKELVVLAFSLKAGDNVSCGCYGKGLLKKANTTHGMTHTRIYKLYKGMIQRCTNPKAQYYEYYGGAGVVICDRWLESFENFYNDTKEGYAPHLTLDRFPDRKGNYEPSNFRWATQKQQVDNRDVTIRLTINGIDATIAEWSKISGTKHATINTRYFRGWSHEECVYGKRSERWN